MLDSWCRKAERLLREILVEQVDLEDKKLKRFIADQFGREFGVTVCDIKVNIKDGVKTASLKLLSSGKIQLISTYLPVHQ